MEHMRNDLSTHYGPCDDTACTYYLKENDMNIKCYRVWFKDGSALLVDATCSAEAKDMAVELAKQQNLKARPSDPERQIARAECLER